MSDSNTIDELLAKLAQVLIRCFVLGLVTLLLWGCAMMLAGDLAYNIHVKFVPITRQQFDVIHYTGMLMFKAAVFVLFFFPYIGIRLVLRKQSA